MAAGGGSGNMGLAQVIDLTRYEQNVINQNLMERQSSKEAMINAQKGLSKFLKGWDKGIEKIRGKRAAELDEIRDSAYENIQRAFRENGYNEQSFDEVAKIKSAMQRQINTAFQEQQHLDGLRKELQKNPDKYNLEQSGANLQKLENEPLGSVMDYEEGILVPRGDNAVDMLVDFQKKTQNLDNPVEAWKTTPESKALYQEGLGTLWNTDPEYDAYLSRQSEVAKMNKRSNSKEADSKASLFSKDGSLKYPGKPEVTGFWKDQVKQRGTYKHPWPDGSTVVFDHGIDHPQRPQVNYAGVPVVGEDGKTENRDISGKLAAYVTKRTAEGVKHYAIIEEPQGKNIFGQALGIEMKFVELDEDGMRREKSQRRGFFDAYLSAQKVTAEENSQAVEDIINNLDTQTEEDE